MTWKSVVSISLIIIMACVMISGCRIASPQPNNQMIPETQKEAFFQAVQKTNWLVTVSIVGIAISVFAFLNGNKGAMAAAVACFVCLSISLAVARYATVIAIGGTIISLGLSAYTIFVKNRALKEIVTDIQEFKNDVPVWSIKDYLSKQADTTKSIVKKIKEKI